MTITKSIKLIDNAAATITSQPVDVKSPMRISLFFRRTGHIAGNTVFTVEVSPNGNDDTPVWFAYRKMIRNITNTNTEQLTRVNTLTLNSNGTAMVTLDLQSSGDTFTHFRVIATRTTDGNSDCWAVVTVAS